MTKHIFPSKIGVRRGKLTVIANIIPSQGKKNRGGLWQAICDCGKEKNVKGHDFKSTRGPQSCGCAVLEQIAQGGKNRRRYAASTINIAYANHRYGAKTDGRKPLDRTDWDKIVFQPCHYCGRKDVKNRAHNFIKNNAFLHPSSEELERFRVEMNGVDRIDSSRGYDVENCLPCCGMCNRMKNSHPQNLFLDHIRRVYHHLHLQDETYQATPVPSCSNSSTTPSE